MRNIDATTYDAQMIDAFKAEEMIRASLGERGQDHSRPLAILSFEYGWIGLDAPNIADQHCWPGLRVAERDTGSLLLVPLELTLADILFDYAQTRALSKVLPDYDSESD